MTVILPILSWYCCYTTLCNAKIVVCRSQRWIHCAHVGSVTVLRRRLVQTTNSWLRQLKGYSLRKFLKEFLQKNWTRRRLHCLLSNTDEYGSAESQAVVNRILHARLATRC